MRLVLTKGAVLANSPEAPKPTDHALGSTMEEAAAGQRTSSTARCRPRALSSSGKRH